MSGDRTLGQDARLWNQVVWQCSFCGVLCVTGTRDDSSLAVRHEAPVCDEFIAMDVVEFVEANYAAQITRGGN